jgi:NADH-quinone oxidoreductase subunit M
VTFPLLSVTLFLPLLGAGLLAAWRGMPARGAHAVGLAASGLTLLGSLLMWARGVPGDGFRQVEEVAWIPSLGAAYRVGVDGISLPLVLMTAILFFVSLVYSIKVRERARSYIALFLLLETACIGTFLALDAVLFYVFFAVTLVGMYFVIA